MKIQAILFDLDGTLIDSERAYARSLRSVGIDPTGELYRRARENVKNRLSPGHVSARNRLLYFKEILELEGRFSADGVLSLMSRYEQALSQDFLAQWQKLGRLALMKTLSARFPLAILTNENTRTQLLKLGALDPLGELFKKVITSEEIGVEKPSPLAFEAAYSRLGVAPRDCLFVGDDWDADIMPAQAAGLQVIWTVEFRPNADLETARKQGVCTVANLNDLQDITSP